MCYYFNNLYYMFYSDFVYFLLGDTLWYSVTFLGHIHSWFQPYNTVKPVLNGYSNRRPKVGFQDRLSLIAGQKYFRMLQESVPQYFLPSLSYNLSLRPLLCLFLSGRLRQVLLYKARFFCRDQHLL